MHQDFADCGCWVRDGGCSQALEERSSIPYVRPTRLEQSVVSTVSITPVIFSACVLLCGDMRTLTN